MLKKSTSRTQKQLIAENEEVHARLDEAKETSRAIRGGHSEALVASGAGGKQIVTLKQSELRYRRLFEAAQDGILILDAETGAINDVNPYLIKMLGYSRKVFIGKKLWEVGAFKDIEASQEAFEALQKNEYIRYDDLPLKTKDGRLVPVEFVSNVYQVDAEKVIQCNIRNISARKQVAEALRESEIRYRLLVDALPDGVVVHSQGHVVFANPASATLLGATSPADLSGKPVMEFVHPDSRKLVLKRIQQSLSEGIPFPLMAEKFVREDGTPIDVEVSAMPFSYAGKPAMLTVFNDITKRKQAEAEIRQRLSEMELLYQSGLAFSQLLNPKTIAEKIIELLDQKMDWHHTAIRLYHAENQTLELLAFNLPDLDNRAENSAAEERFIKVIQSPDQGISGWVIRNGQSVRSNDLKNDPHYLESYPGLQSGLYVPIKIAERVIGVISIESEQVEAFSAADERLTTILATQAASAMDNALLLSDLKYSNIELALTYDATIEGWSCALDLRDKETEGHSQRVTELTLRLARSMGMGEEELVHVRRGALLHDIGKMGVPDSILLKPGSLTGEEWALMKKHPTFAYELLAPIRYLRLALDLPYCHHEKWDGSGYPRRLKGIRIPLAARIFAIVDVWDALNSDRTYRPAWAKEKAIEHIRALSGTHFDPHVVDVFMQMIDST